MYVHSFLRLLLTSVVLLTLTACGGGGSGGGSLIGDGTGGGDGTGDGTTTDPSVGTITLAISGLVDASGAEDNVLAGNEVATLRADVTENGNPANLVVLFDTTAGQLLQTSAQAVDGVAEVQITGDGNAGAATVTASATLADGTEISATLIVQTIADGPAIRILKEDGTPAATVELRAAESQNIIVEVLDWDDTPISGVGVSFVSTALTSSAASGVTGADGRIPVTLTGTNESSGGSFDATATFGTFELDASIIANSLGVNTQDNFIVINEDAVTAALGDGVLDGNEKVNVSATVTQDGVVRDGVSVVFTATRGVLSPASATTRNGGVATVQLQGDGQAGVSQVTASATLSNGIEITDTINVQTTEVTPTLTLVLRNAAGNSITTFGANQDLILEATIKDHDGGSLGEDAGVNVTFNIGTLGTADNLSDVTELGVCPVNGVKATDDDCAFIRLTSTATAAVGDMTATATINGIALSDTITVTNTGQNSGSPAQSSFNLTRAQAGTAFATEDVVAVEGDIFNNQEITIRADLADIFSNPVPTGTIINFQTELGDITETCSTGSGVNAGTCEVTFASGDPRAPEDEEVRFKNLDQDNCPSELIIDEQVTIGGAGNGPTDYRVKDIIRVKLNGTSTVLTEGTNYTQTSFGIACVTCTAGQVMQITYRRLWLDEEDDSNSTYVLLNPGVATEPFLDVTSTPCLAPSRSRVQVISGSINPTASTTVTGVSTKFREELAVGDKIKVSGEVRTVVTIPSNTSLTVDTAFSDNANDVNPERIAAPAYFGGMGQPYGGRSTILAYAEGEEAFTDTNGNGEYDFGEQFDDLTEVVFDKNEDGVLGDIDGDSASAGTFGPYRDAGLGNNAPGQAREKRNPNCYGPSSIIGAVDGKNDSKDGEEYCFQQGGEEELFIDYDGDGVLDVGNGIYNGSRCLRPLQDADGDGEADDTVCTTDLLNISQSVQVLMAGSIARTEFRAWGKNGNGGTFGFGEIISGIENRAGESFSASVDSPLDWQLITTNGTNVAALDDSLPGVPLGGANIDTDVAGIDTDDDRTDVEEQVGILEIGNPFPTRYAKYTVDFKITQFTRGALDVFVNEQQIIDDCEGTVGATITCTSDEFELTSTANMRFVVGEGPANNFSFKGVLTDVNVNGVTTGINGDFKSDKNVVSNDGTNTTLKEFFVGNDHNATTVFPGVSERKNADGEVPKLTLSATWANTPEAAVASGTFWFTDRYNGQLPEGTEVKIESDNRTGCTLLSVGGTAVDAPDPGINDGGTHSGTVVVGTTATTWTTFQVTTGGAGSGTLIATVTTKPSNTVTTDSISCNLLK